MQKAQKIYEFAYHLIPDLNDEQAANASREILNLISSLDGQIKEISEPQKRKLAYQINHFSHSYFGWFTFNMPQTGLESLKAKLKFEPKILRYLIVTLETPKIRKSAKPPRMITPQPVEPQRTEKQEVKTSEKSGAAEEGKIRLEEIDKKLEEILK